MWPAVYYSFARNVAAEIFSLSVGPLSLGCPPRCKAVGWHYHSVGVLRMRHSLLCFSHLRWDFVFQRPQHILSRLAKDWDVYFIEEAIVAKTSGIHVKADRSGVQVVQIHVEDGSDIGQ